MDNTIGYMRKVVRRVIAVFSRRLRQMAMRINADFFVDHWGVERTCGRVAQDLRTGVPKSVAPLFNPVIRGYRLIDGKQTR
jgi:hypothetical protein